MTRDCPNCEQGKHRICNEFVLTDEDRGEDVWMPCPCAEREHTALVHLVPVDETEDEW